MKKSSSKPPTERNKSALMHMNDPDTASTSWVLFSSRKVRLYRPKTRLLGKRPDSPTNLNAATCGDGKLRLQASCRLPSRFTILHPATPICSCVWKNSHITENV